MSEAILVALKVLADLEPSVVGVVSALLNRVRDIVSDGSDQAIFAHVAAVAVISVATSTLFSREEQRAIARDAIVHALDDLSVAVPPLTAIDTFLMEALP